MEFGVFSTVVFYRKYRPFKLSEVVGQEPIITTLKNALKQGRIAHAYLFAGPRGTGKTSVARILAGSLNCRENRETMGEPCGLCDSCRAVLGGNYFDLIEIDAASNRGIDEIRNLRETVHYPPQQGRFKIYVLDEAHMLTEHAFNAFLKTLEEPPAHIVFILCTTEPHKIPLTIISRTQRFDFKLADLNTVVTHLAKIAALENLSIDKQALQLIGELANGSFRDGLMFLEKVAAAEIPQERTLSSSAGFDLEYVRRVLGLMNEKDAEDLINLITQKDTNSALILLNDLIERGINVEHLIKTMVRFLRKDLICGLGKLELREKMELLKLLVAASRETRLSPVAHLPLELAILEYCQNLEVGSGKLEAGNQESEVRDQKSGSGEKGIEVEERESKSRTTPPVEELKKIWPDFLAKIKPHNHTLEALLRGCRPVSIEEGILRLDFFYPFHKEQIEKEQNKHLVEEVASLVFGQKLRLHCFLAEKPPVQVMSIPKKTDLLEIAKEFFGGEIISG